jgi:hypothetical protein
MVGKKSRIEMMLHLPDGFFTDETILLGWLLLKRQAPRQHAGHGPALRDLIE